MDDKIGTYKTNTGGKVFCCQKLRAHGMLWG